MTTTVQQRTMPITEASTRMETDAVGTHGTGGKKDDADALFRCEGFLDNCGQIQMASGQFPAHSDRVRHLEIILDPVPRRGHAERQHQFPNVTTLTVTCPKKGPTRLRAAAPASSSSGSSGAADDEQEPTTPQRPWAFLADPSRVTSLEWAVGQDKERLCRDAEHCLQPWRLAQQLHADAWSALPHVSRLAVRNVVRYSWALETALGIDALLLRNPAVPSRVERMLHIYLTGWYNYMYYRDDTEARSALLYANQRGFACNWRSEEDGWDPIREKEGCPILPSRWWRTAKRLGDTVHLAERVLPGLRASLDFYGRKLDLFREAVFRETGGRSTQTRNAASSSAVGAAHNGNEERSPDGAPPPTAEEWIRALPRKVGFHYLKAWKMPHDPALVENWVWRRSDVLHHEEIQGNLMRGTPNRPLEFNTIVCALEDQWGVNEMVDPFQHETWKKYIQAIELLKPSEPLVAVEPTDPAFVSKPRASLERVEFGAYDPDRVWFEQPNNRATTAVASADRLQRRYVHMKALWQKLSDYANQQQNQGTGPVQP